MNTLDTLDEVQPLLSKSIVVLLRRFRSYLHLGDVLVKGDKVLPVVLGEETAQPRQLILDVLVLHHSHLQVLAEVLPW